MLLDVAAAPLVDRLVVVADHADAGAQLVQLLDHRLLDRVHVLVLVDDDVLDALGQPLAQPSLFVSSATASLRIPE